MRKVKYSRILTIIVFLCIIFQIVGTVFAKSIDTIVLKSEKMEMKINTKGLLIREEYVVYSNSSGKVDFLVQEGDKVKKSQNIATIYSNNTSVNINKEIEDLEKEISEIKSGENNISKVDIDKLNKDINKISSKMQLDILSKDYKDINNDKEEVSVLIEERNRLLNNNINLKKIETKENQKSILSNKLKKNSSTLISNISGIVSYKFDGNEKEYNLNNLFQITSKQIDRTTNEYIDVKASKEDIKDNEPILRIINNNNNTYIAISIDKEKQKLFKLDNNVKVNFNGVELDGKVEQIYNDQGNIIVILRISNENIGIYDTRVGEFDIIYKQIEGLKIPRSSIVVVDGKQGVYVVNQETKKSEFIELRGTLYEDEEFVYIDYYKNSIQGIESINLYDEIILKPNTINKNIKIK